MRLSRCARIAAGPAAGLVSVLLLLGTASSDLAVDGDASATLGPILTLSATGVYSPPLVAMDPSGNAVFTWTQFEYAGMVVVVQARTLSAAGVLSAVETLATHSASPHVGIDASGNAVFVWSRFNKSIQTRSRSATGVLSAVQNLSETGDVRLGDGFHPRVAVSPDGRAVFTWDRDVESIGSKPRVQARARSAAGALSGVWTLSASPEGNLGPGFRLDMSPDVGVDADGNAVFVWTRRVWTRRHGYYWRVETRARSRAGAWSAVQVVSPPGYDPGYDAINVRMAVAPGGGAV